MSEVVATGHRFQPSDSLLLYLLSYRLLNKPPLPVFSYIEEADIYAEHPSELFKSCPDCSELHFISPLKRTVGGKRIDRRVGNGTWKSQHTHNVYNEEKERILGFKKSFSFITFEDGKEECSGWVMDEFTVKNYSEYGVENSEILSICRIRNRKTIGGSDVSKLLLCQRDWGSLVESRCLSPDLQEELELKYKIHSKGILFQGFKFDPTDLQLLDFLRKKLQNEDSIPMYIREANVYGSEDPFCIWSRFESSNSHSDDLFLFSTINFKGGSVNRKFKRKGGEGKWRIQKTHQLFGDVEKTDMLGFKKVFSFHSRDAKQKSVFIMYELTLLAESSWAICRLKRSKRMESTLDS